MINMIKMLLLLAVIIFLLVKLIKKFGKRAVVCILAVAIVLFVAGTINNLPKKLDEPVFVRNLVYAADMDAEVEFIANKSWNKEVEDLTIPNLPENMSLQYYDDEVEDWSKFDVHNLSFGVGVEELSESGGLTEPFEFSEIIIKWNDGTETTANIGIIHMSAVEEDDVLEFTGSSSSIEADDASINEESFYATKDLMITEVYIPFADKLKGYIYDVAFEGKSIDKITADKPVKVEKGATPKLTYKLSGTNNLGCGSIHLECQIKAVDKTGEEHISLFYIHALQGRNMSEWIDQQLMNAETVWAE